MIETVRDGKPGTAMKSFARVLSPSDIDAVVDFVRQHFMRNKAANTAYHTPQNGWTDMRQYAPAFAFVEGRIPLDTPEQKLTAAQRTGKYIFMNSCVSCHDRAHSEDKSVIFEPHAVSYPRNQYSPQRAKPDSISASSPYIKHDQRPRIANLSGA